MIPVAPGCSADGTNTAVSTTVIATIAPVICFIALRVAACGSRRSSVMMRSTFSMTTMASSTTMPMASTMPKSVSWFTEKCSTARPMKVPRSATGMTSVGIRVARRFCRKISITRNTSTIASPRVIRTSRIEALMKGVVSNGTVQLTPAGRVRARRAISVLTASATASALAPGERNTARPPAGLPLNTAASPYFWPPKEMLATSLSLTTLPLALARRMMLRNCCSEVNSLSPETVAVNPWPLIAGSAPSAPVANCAFCAFTALSTWVVERP
jgi:hypothetical protein